MPAVSIVIPAYNAAAYLRATIDSVLASSFLDFEVVIVDDGSTDSTSDVARSITDPRVRVISQANKGMSASRNIAISSGNSEFIALLDADDVWHPNKLALQVEKLRQAPEYGICYSEFKVWHGEVDEKFFAPINNSDISKDLSGWIYPKMILTNFVLPSTLIFRRTVWDMLGPFLCDNQQTDDWEYLVRASRQFEFVKIAAALVLYRQHPTSLSRRPSAVNHTEVMREQLIQRYQYNCPHGGPVDRIELQRRRYLGLRHFADAHLVAGNFKLGLSQITRLLLSEPFRGETILTVIKATRRRLLKLIGN